MADSGHQPRRWFRKDKASGRWIAYGLCDPEYQVHSADGGCNLWWPRRRDAETRADEIVYESVSGARPEVVRDLLARGDVEGLEFDDPDLGGTF